MPFAPFDISRPLMAAEQINAVRDQSNFRRLREAALGEQMEWQRADREQANMDRTEEKRQANSKWLVDASGAAMQAPDRNRAIRAFVNEGKARGIFTPDTTLTSDELAAQHEEWKVQLGMVPQKAQPLSAEGKIVADQNAGILSPEQAQSALQPNRADGGFDLSPGQVRFSADGKQIASVPAAQPAKPVFRSLTPDEVKQVGLPDGTAAQIDQNTGKIDVLSKRDNTGALSQKDRTTAKMKLNTVRLAREQLADIQTAFDGIKGTFSAGPMGTGRLPSKGAASFDRAVDGMRSTLTALTRVPGVGAMSDYETRLDQAKFPTRFEYEDVTQQQIDQIAKQLNLIELGYTDLMGETPEAEQPQQSTGGPQPGAIEDGYKFLGGDPSKPESWQKVQ
jgi:hypothetical protein